jgi:hypothetical protein
VGEVGAPGGCPGGSPPGEDKKLCNRPKAVQFRRICNLPRWLPGWVVCPGNVPRWYPPRESCSTPGAEILTPAASKLPSFQASKLPSFQASKLPSFQASKLPSFQASKLPSRPWLLTQLCSRSAGAPPAARSPEHPIPRPLTPPPYSAPAARGTQPEQPTIIF